MQDKTGKVKRFLRKAVLPAVLLAAALAELLFLGGLKRGSIDFSVLPCSLLEISTGSMTPAIRVGDCVLVDKTPFSEVQVGDIIAYESLGSLVIHRVVETGAEAVVTKGDANPVNDPPVAPEDYRGRVMLVIPRLGRFFSLQRSWPGRLALAAVLALIVFGTDLFMFLLSLPEKWAAKRKLPPKQN